MQSRDLVVKRFPAFIKSAHTPTDNLADKRVIDSSLASRQLNNDLQQG